MQRQKKKKEESSRFQKFTAFFKESTSLITAITALIGAIIGLLYLFYGKQDGSLTSIFPTGTPESNCPTYKRGFVQTGIMANQGLQNIYIVNSDESLTEPHLLVFEGADGNLVGMTLFEYNRERSEFVLKSIVDRYCYEVKQSEDNIVQPVLFSNGAVTTIKLSDQATYSLKLLYEDNYIRAEFSDTR